MPTYQYRCAGCGYEFEEFGSITDSHIKNCPNCAQKAELVISGGVGFLLKGSGFYSTDHRSESYKKAESKEKSESSPVKKTEAKKDSIKTPPKNND
jgi:putative FmdB family regulatory protein